MEHQSVLRRVESFGRELFRSSGYSFAAVAGAIIVTVTFVIAVGSKKDVEAEISWTNYFQNGNINISSRGKQIMAICHDCHDLFS